MDSYSAYLLACLALGVLRISEALLLRAAMTRHLSALSMGLDGLWAILSVLVVMYAPADEVRGVAVWLALGTLGGWLLIRKGHLLKVAAAPASRSALPEWHKEYLLYFGVGLACLSLVAWVRYQPAEPQTFAAFARQTSGVIWCCFLLYAVSRAGLNVFRLYSQRNLDRGVLVGLRDHPSCKELFGDIRRVKCKPEDSGKYAHEDVFVYRVFGSHAEGVVVAEFRELSGSFAELVQGLVYLDSGERCSINTGQTVSSGKSSAEARARAPYEKLQTAVSNPLKRAS